MSAILLRSAIVARRSLLYRIRFETAIRQATELSMRDAGNSNFDGRPKTTENSTWIRNCGQPTNQQTNPPSRAELASLHLWFGFESDVTTARMRMSVRLSHMGGRSRNTLQHWPKLWTARLNSSWPLIRGLWNFGPTFFFLLTGAFKSNTEKSSTKTHVRPQFICVAVFFIYFFIYFTRDVHKQLLFYLATNSH